MGARRWAGLLRGARIAWLLAALALAATATAEEVTETARLAVEVALWATVFWLVLDWGFAALKVYRKGGGAATRAYLLSLLGLVAAVSALAVPLGLLLGYRSPGLWTFGSVWVFTLMASAPRLGRLWRVLSREAGSLAAVGALGLAMLFLSGAGLYVLEGGSQPEHFGSIPESLWWAMNTVTGVGIEAVPETVVGRLIASALMVLGLAVFGLWAGIIATGFAAEVRREEFLGAWELVARVPFLRSLGPAAIADLAGTLRRMDVPENTVVVRKGQRGECMYFVAEGAVEVQLPSGPVPLEEGSFFGEMALLEGGGGIRSATIRCTRPATLLVLDVADFRALISRHPSLAVAVEEEAARRRTQEGERQRQRAGGAAEPARA
jgi:voltage-gated potassium channel